MWGDTAPRTGGGSDDLHHAYGDLGPRVPGRSRDGGLRAQPGSAVQEQSQAGRFDLIKLDIEGEELRILPDAASRAVLCEAVCMFMELHERFEPGCDAAFKDFLQVRRRIHVPYACAMCMHPHTSPVTTTCWLCSLATPSSPH